MIFEEPQPERGALRRAIDDAYRADETRAVRGLLDDLEIAPESNERIAQMSRRLVEAVRRNRLGKGGIDAFLQEYGLSTQEGVMLMCIAEALLRIPDEDTQERLIRDKISAADWARHLGHSASLFVNASTFALMLTGRVVRLSDLRGPSVAAVMRRLIARLGEPVIREAVLQAMRILGRQFVMGRTIEEALARAQTLEARGYRYSYDMLGEAARTMADAERYFQSYRHAIHAIGKVAADRGPIESPGISVKLSALHPRYELAKARRVMDELTPRLVALAKDAMAANVGLTVDAEEADRLDLSLDVIEAVSGDPELKGWDGFGLAVQAYQKRAPLVIDWLADMARRHDRRLPVRLVKGAYWDTEIKRAQERGVEGYPVFTRKASTDVCYLACARRMLGHRDVLYPQFATHNAHSIAAVMEFAGNNRAFEFQRLHGMGEALYEEVIEKEKVGVACRLYAPVGQHEDLLPYLVRRLLENGANTSFVNRIQDEKLPVDEIIADPIRHVRGLAHVPHPRIPRPRDLYGPARRNAEGVDLVNRAALAPLGEAMARAAERSWSARPIVGGQETNGAVRQTVSPADHRRVIGEASDASDDDVETALAAAAKAADGWRRTPVEERAACLERAADLMEQEMAALMALAVREGGKTLNDALAEVREAIDFCRYYAMRAREDFAGPVRLRIPSGGRREMRLEGSGVVVCISPWNFPLAIFTGQVAGALVAGNAVIAKPAEQTPLIAAEAVRLLHRAGVPEDVLHLLPGGGETVGAALVADPRVAGVCFTGSIEVARAINRALARRDGPIARLIAETGGQNAMIVDSSALPEQVVQDVITSAFQSAGQRCSALRVLYVQDDVADKMLDMLAGAMDEIAVGDPSLLSTDVGPVIDAEAKAMLEGHIKRMQGEARLIRQVRLGPRTEHGTFVGPVAFEIDRLSRLQREVFGPILHVVRYDADRLDEVVDAINGTGYGLTLGIHSRIDTTVHAIHARARVGNTYVNRNQIGSIVGVQPFGGQGLSGTGPKAGGPHYLPRLAIEREIDVEADDGDGADPMAGPADPAAFGISRRALETALDAAAGAFESWAGRAVAERAAILERAADRLEEAASRLAGLAPDGAHGVAHAIDSLHVFAAQARAELAEPTLLPGPTGERNEYSLAPRGVFACIAAEGAGIGPFVAQIAAALAPGNTAIAVAARSELCTTVVDLMQAAGIPEAAVAAVERGTDGSVEELIVDPRIAGVALAGSQVLARATAQKLAALEGPIRPLVVHADRGDAAEMAGNPLASGPHYLHRFTTERSLSIDTTAAGGNASLLSLGDEQTL